MIETFYNITATNYRRSIATPTSTDVITTVTSFVGVIRPVTDLSSLYVENNIGKEFDLVCDETIDIKVQDDVIVSGGKYKVLGVTSYEDLYDGTDSYLNVRLVK